MSSMTGILSLLFALVARSAALSCIECMSESSSCTGSSVTCPSGYVCGSAYKETVIGEEKSETFIRTCMPSAVCDFEGSISILKGHIQQASSCCTDDNCTPYFPKLPKVCYFDNGATCPSCVSTQSTHCDASDIIFCTKEEYHCIVHTIKITKGPYNVSKVFRGCATSSMCKLGSLSLSIEGSSITYQHICPSGGLSVQNIAMTPAIVCLLLLKLFF